MAYKVLFPQGKKKAFTLSYDDNQIHDRRLIELFRKYQVKGTFHINSGTVSTESDGNEFVTWKELKNLYDGQEVSCHGVNHPYFGQLTRLEKNNEILEDKRALERACGYIVRGMSYPFGEYSDEIITVAKNAGMEYSRTVQDTMGFEWPTDFMKWHPTCHHNIIFENSKMLETFLNTPSYMNLPLLYVWGHSFEFERQNNWEQMEYFLSQISSQESVWYATNIEIKDYIVAVRNLNISADQNMIYNPSATTISIMTDGDVKELHAKETIYL